MNVQNVEGNRMEIVGLIGMLVICSVEDVRRKEMHLLILLGFGVLGIGLHMAFRSMSIYEILGGMLIGVILLLLSILSDGKIGKGDGVLMVVTGTYLGFWNNLLLLWFATCLTGVFGLIVYFRRRQTDVELPFAPFVLAACMVGCVFQLMRG